MNGSISDTDTEHIARDDWKRVESCIGFGLSIYWPFGLFVFLPQDAAWWIIAPVVAAAALIALVLRRQHGLKDE